MNDLDILLQPVSAESPAGDDLEYDSDFLAMVQAAEGTPERRMGDSLVPAEEPDWRHVRTLAVDLLKRSKDLRPAVFLTRALLHIQGLPGLGAGLGVLTGLVNGFWDDLHPRLDPEEDMDPGARVNVLLDLCGQGTLLMPLRTTPLIRSRVFGPVSYRDIEIADGKAAAPRDAQPRDSAAIAGAFQDCALEELSSAALGANTALTQARALSDALATHVSADLMPDFSPLTDLLRAVQGVLQARLGERRPESLNGGYSEPGPGSGAEMPPPSTPDRLGTGIHSREDVVRSLDRLCDYYLRNEPSSPVPLLLQRARRLVTGNFVDIVRDLAPDALPQIQKVCGIDDKP
jgi:type VI secretion system protein ImpA